MADTVRYLLEQMIPELEDMVKKGYFSKHEVKEIVNKRQDFEYRLKRRAALKVDFLRYIEYEQKLEQLRKLRRKKLKITGKKTVADFGIRKRIHFIFERATRKFKSDLSLWQKWLDYCKDTNSTKQFSKVITKALSRHSTTGALWVQAAAWEFEQNGNDSAARSLLQQGIRMCGQDEALWSEYLRMELLYVAKLQARRKVLGIDSHRVTDTGTGAGGDAPSTSSAAADPAPDATQQQVLSGAVARVVLLAACKQLPHSLLLRRRLLAVLRDCSSVAGVSALQDLVYEQLEKDFGTSSEAWDLRARRHLDPATGAVYDAAGCRRACRVYEQGCKVMGGAVMYELHAAYLQQIMAGLGGGGGGSHAAVEDLVQVATKFFTVCDKAHLGGHASEALYREWVATAQRLDQRKMAVKAVRHACERHPGSAELWRCRLDLELQQGTVSQPGRAAALLGAALQAVGPDHADDIWVQVMDVLEPGSQSWSEVEALMLKALSSSAQGPLHGGRGLLAAHMLRRVQQCQGLSAARQLYRRLFQLPPAGGDLYRAVIAMEKEAAAGSSEGPHSRPVQQAYEAAAQAYGSCDVELWLDWALYQQQVLRQGSGTVYWRAVKELQQPDTFIERYQQLVREGTANS